MSGNAHVILQKSAKKVFNTIAAHAGKAFHVHCEIGIVVSGITLLEVLRQQ
ncbi:MAG: hypothetical protein CM15mP84_08760 [Cellvibrionales bacterium]|nr:MAG: hypothetical protein CM15mP84_08760 [Cellvibrionales bacterium]